MARATAHSLGASRDRPTLSVRLLVARAISAERLALLAICLLGLALRVWGLNWGLPWAFLSDEKHYVDRANEMLKTGDPNPHYFRNPSLLTYLIIGELHVIRLLGPLAGPLASDVPGSANLLARLDSALIGTASVGLLYAVGATLFTRRVGLIAALFLAVAFLHVRNSQYGVNDVPSVGFLLLSFYFVVLLLRQPALRWYVLAGVAGGLAASTKYNMGFFFVPLLAAHWLARRVATRTLNVARPWRRSALVALGLAGTSSLAAYLIGTPYTLLDFPRFRSDFLTQYGFGTIRSSPGLSPEPIPLMYLKAMLQGFGALPLALAFVGLGHLVWPGERLRKRTASAILLLAFPVIYLAFMLPKAVYFPRLVLPLLPFFCLLAACGASWLIGQLRPAWRPAGAFTLLAAALAQPLANDLQHHRIMMQADTRVLANEWIQANLPHGSRLKADEYALLDRSAAHRTYTPNSANLEVEEFEREPEDDDASHFIKRKYQYVVTSSFLYDRYRANPALPEWREILERYNRLHRSLEQEGQLAARLSPGVGGRELPHRDEDMRTPFWNLEEYERPGPTVRIYSLPALAGGGS
jgi:4-amino-4-deoxy-L-arabinose transferase-like glycosyltransferase